MPRPTSRVWEGDTYTAHARTRELIWHTVREMEQILKQQEELLKFGEELLKESSKKMREAAGPDAWKQAYEMWMVRSLVEERHFASNCIA